MPDDPAQGLPRLSQTLEFAWWEVYGWTRLTDRDQLTVGYLDSRFANRIRSDVGDARFRTEFTTGQVYALWERNPESWLHWLFSLYAGQADSETRVGTDAPKPGDETGAQMKAGIGLVLAEAGHYRFLFNSTWDLDILAERAWDGGNVQVQILF